MSTLKYTYGYAIQEPGDNFDAGSATLTYSTDSSNGASFVVNITSLSVKNTTPSSATSYSTYATYPYVIKVGDTQVASGSVSSVAKGSTKTVTLNKQKSFTRTHSSSSTTIVVTGNDGAVFTDTQIVALTIPARPSYTVTYNANSGSGAPSSQTKWYGESLVLSSTKPTRTNYVFKRWNTNTSDTGTAYNSGATYTGNAALTLYAIWNAYVYFNANGGSGAPATQTKVYGQDLTLSSTKPTRSGYVFKRWNTNTSDTGTAYESGATYTSNSTMTVYAIWNPLITYDANGGSGAPATQTKTYGSALTLQTSTPTRAGYTFSKWNTARDGTGTSYNAGGTVAAGMNTATTLYAQWTKNPEPPNISRLTVFRSDSNRSQKDDGTYCYVEVAWSIDTTNVSGNTATVTGVITPEVGQSQTITFDASGSSGTSGTAKANVYLGDDSLDMQYTVMVTVTDRRTSTSRANILTRALFIFDFKSGGVSLGIGSAAPLSGLEVGWVSKFTNAVSMLSTLSVAGNVSVAGSLSAPELTMASVTSDVAMAGSGWTIASQEAHTVHKVVSVRVTIRPTANITAPAQKSGVLTFNSGYRPKAIQGFANYYGCGQITTSGSVSFMVLTNITTSTDIVVGATFIKP